MKKILLICVLLAGCAGTQFEKPQGVKDDLAYTAAGWKAANLTAIDLCKREVLTPAQCAKAEALSTEVETAVILGQTAIKDGDIPAAKNSAAVAARALISLQAIVAARDKKSELTTEGFFV